MVGSKAPHHTFAGNCSTEATHLFGLSKSGAAFTAAMLSLGGYDAIRLIEAKWRHRLALVVPTREHE